jgi:hypothetical protein
LSYALTARENFVRFDVDRDRFDRHALTMHLDPAPVKARPEPHLPVQGRRGHDRLFEIVENAVGERTAVGIDAGRVNEAEQGDAAPGAAKTR